MQNISKVLADIMKSRDIKYDFDTLAKKAIQDPEVQAFIAENKDRLQADAVERSASNIYEFVKQRDIVLNNEKSTVSGYQPKLVVNDGLIDVTYQPTAQTIAAEKNREIANNVSLISISPAFKNADIKKFDLDEGRKKALEESVMAANNIINHQSTKGIYLSGDFGIGKTYLLAALANKLAERNFSVALLHVPTFIAELSSYFQDNSLNAEIQKLKNIDVLMFDDIGAESLSQWSRDDVLGVILQARMENNLPTFFSSNFDMNALEAHLATTKNGEEPVKAARLMERIRFLAKEVQMHGPNRRQN